MQKSLEMCGLKMRHFQIKLSYAEEIEGELLKVTFK